MVPGVPGLTGLSVPRAVVKELRAGGDSVTVQPRPRGGQTVRGINIRRDSATLRLVSKVKPLVASLYAETYQISRSAIFLISSLTDCDCRR